MVMKIGLLWKEIMMGIQEIWVVTLEEEIMEKEQMGIVIFEKRFEKRSMIHRKFVGIVKDLIGMIHRV